MRANTYSNLAVVLLMVNRLDDAAAIAAEAEKRKLLTDALLEANYFRAFLRNDSAEKQPGLTRLAVQQLAHGEARTKANRWHN